MDASTALRAIRTGWFFVLLGVLGAVGGAAALHATAAPFYQSSASYIVTPYQDPNDPGVVQESIRTLDDARSRAIVATFAQVLDSGDIQAEAAAGVGTAGLSVTDYDFAATLLPEANVVELTVTGPEPHATALLSDAVGSLASARFKELYQIYNIVRLDAPVVPTSPANTPLVQMLIMAGALGVLVGAALALLWGAPKIRRMHSREQRLLSYSVSEDPSVVTPFRREDHRAAGSG
ncbi:MAG: hypothetical protein KJ698_10610 [Actinobacteria bacterium]|nr:hypothetical protein [Actinomycetota bacterium]MBU1493040.1 hypothetical protein [Actinomycetota bacterium]